MANCPAVITCTDVMADEHPELVIAYMKAMIKVGRWANEHKHAAAVILNRQTFYLDAEDTYQGIKDVDMVPNLSAQNMESIEIGKDFMFSHGYIKRDFDVDEWARPEFLEKAAEEVLKEEWEQRSWSKLPQGGALEVEGVRLGYAVERRAVRVPLSRTARHLRRRRPAGRRACGNRQGTKRRSRSAHPLGCADGDRLDPARVPAGRDPVREPQVLHLARHHRARHLGHLHARDASMEVQLIEVVIVSRGDHLVTFRASD